MFSGNPILLVEDQEHDVFLMRRAFTLAGIDKHIHAVQDAEEAIDYLSGCIYGDAFRYPRPCLLLTDIKMPRMDGFDLLEWLRGQYHFADLPKLVISSSCHEVDLKRSLELGATAYFIKPNNYHRLVDMVRIWARDWLSPRCLEQAGDKMIRG